MEAGKDWSKTIPGQHRTDCKGLATPPEILAEGPVIVSLPEEVAPVAVEPPVAVIDAAPEAVVEAAPEPAVEAAAEEVAPVEAAPEAPIEDAAQASAE